MHTPKINYTMKSEVAIALSLQLCSMHYTALQMNNSVRNFSTMNQQTSGKPRGDYNSPQSAKIS